MGFNVQGQPKEGAGLYGPLPNTAPPTSTDFAILVAKKKAEVEGLVLQMSQTEAELANKENNQELKDKVDDMRQELSEAQEALETLEKQMAQETTATQKTGGQTPEESTIASGSTTSAKGAEATNASNPVLAPADPRAEIQTSDTNLFLATSMMAILWKLESLLIHQQIQNKDVERLCKQYGFEEVRLWGKAEAAAAYNADMAQANQMLAQAAASAFSAALTIGAAVYATRLTAKAQNRADTARDNPAYTQARDAAKNDPNNPNHAIVNGNDPLPPLKQLDKDGKVMKDANGKEIELKPGKKQIEEAIAENEQDPNKVINAQKTNTADNAAYDQKKTKLQDKLADNRQDIANLDQQMTYGGDITFWRQTMPSLIQSLTSVIGSGWGATFMMEKAEEDYCRTMASIARDTGGKYLQSAMDAFSAENQSIQALIDFLMQAAQKNTQWASVRA